MRGERRPGCELCEAERMTHWYLEDDLCWVADCDICDTPMVVWWSHGLPSEDVESQLLARLRGVASRLYGAEGFWVDGFRRNIPDHWHAHARPAGGFFGDATRRRRSGDQTL